MTLPALPETGYASRYQGGEGAMRGSVRTQERCPVAGCSFKPVRNPRNRDVIDLICPTHQTRPTRFFIDGRHLADRHGAVGYKFSNNDGEPYDSFNAAYKDLIAIRKEQDDHMFLSTRHNSRAISQHRLEVAYRAWVAQAEKELQETTAKGYRNAFEKYIVPAMGELDVRDLRGLDIIAFQRHLSTLPISVNTERSILRALKTCLEWLRKQDVIDRVPAFPVLRPVPRSHTGWIEPADQERAIALVREDMRLLLETMFALGARPGEAVALKVRDLRDGAVRVERALNGKRELKGTKTGAVSEKVIPADLFSRLAESAKGKLPECWLFVNHARKPFHVRQVSTLWRQAADKVGVSACLYVASRHSRVSTLRCELEKRIAEQLRAELAHKSSVTTLRHYVREKE